MSVSQLFAQEISAVLVRLGISQREAAKRTHITPHALSNMCLGQLPSAGTLLRFSTALGINPTPLFIAAGYPSVPLPAPAPVSQHATGGERDHAVPAGMSIPLPYPIHPAYRAVTDFCLRVVGDSMWPHLLAGDIVGIQTQCRADNGQLVAARLDGAITLARWFFAENKGRLVPDNPAYAPITIDPATMDFTLLGVVAWHLHDWLDP